MSHNNSKLNQPINHTNFTDLFSWDKIRFRMEGKHMVISPYRRKRRAKVTKRELASQERFKDAAKYAKQMYKDPVKLAEVPTRIRKEGKAYTYFVKHYFKSLKPAEADKPQMVTGRKSRQRLKKLGSRGTTPSNRSRTNQSKKLRC